MTELVIIQNRGAVTSSLVVAESFGKEHRNVLQAIDEIKGVAENSADLFYESTYIHHQNKQEYRMYYMNRDGFTLLAMGFTGKEALQFKLKYIEAFNNMEKQLTQPAKLPTTYKEALLALVEEVEKNEALTNDNLILTQQVTEYKPKVEYVDTILNNPSLLNITQIAKDYGMSGAKMNALLSSLKVQYKSSGQWLLYSNHQSFGYTQSDTTTYVDKGITKTKLRTKWTQKGRLFIYELLKKNGILPLIEK